MKNYTNLKHTKKAQSLIEYILILVLISMVSISTLHFLGKRMSFGTNDVQMDQTQTIKDTMTKYCEIKGMKYNRIQDKCE